MAKIISIDGKKIPEQIESSEGLNDKFFDAMKKVHSQASCIIVLGLIESSNSQLIRSSKTDTCTNERVIYMLNCPLFDRLEP
jgi:hypothetical protein